MRITLHRSHSGPAPAPGVATPLYPTPVHQVWSLVNGPAWTRTPRDPVVAYICCCFSELAYLHLTENELGGAGRYWPVPSLAYRELAAARISFDITVAAALDIPAFVFATERFVYAGFLLREVALVAVRGTRPTALADWAINFAAGLDPDPGGPGRLHHGFLAEAERAAPLILRHLNDFSSARCVRFTGHSLGGAVAAALDKTWTHALPSLTPYIFGAPRYGDLAATERAPPHAWRKPGDLVPHLPPRRLGYADAGLEPELIPAEPRRPPGAGKVALRWIPRPGGPPFAVAHAVERYRRLLGQAIAPGFPDLVYWEFAQARARAMRAM